MFGNAVKYMGLFGAILFIIIVGATAILLKGRQKNSNSVNVEYKTPSHIE